jgi:hypothetical protein
MLQRAVKKKIAKDLWGLLIIYFYQHVAVMYLQSVDTTLLALLLRSKLGSRRERTFK